MKVEKNCHNKIVKSFKGLEKKLQNIHSNKYSYKNTIYRGVNKPLNILCPIHGEVTISTAYSHVSGRGCNKCGITTTANKTRTKDIVTQFKKIHKDRYKYENVKLINIDTPVRITCRIHGEFLQSPASHRKGQGCVKCGNITSGRKGSINVKEFIERSNKIHGNIYDYSKVNKVYGVDNLVSIICPKHGEFQQAPKPHMRGVGCSGCANYGFDKHDKAILYFIEIQIPNSSPLFKIGITKKALSSRYTKKYLKLMKILKVIHFSSGKECKKEEQRILEEFKDYRYKGDNILKTGNTEILTVNPITFNTMYVKS